jgi:hypothetical protein
LHVSTKDTSHDGSTHLLTSVIESDNEFPLCAENDILGAEIVSVTRTASGGIEVVVSATIKRFVPVKASAAKK